MADQPEKRWRFRPRFTLLTLLLLMTIVAMAIAMVQLSREVVPLRADNHRLRNEFGYLSIRDENKIYAIQVPVTDPDIQRFRVFLPKNKKYTMYTRVDTIPGLTVQMSREEMLSSLAGMRSGTSASVDGGEHTIDVQMRRNPEQKDDWNLTYRVLGKGAGSDGCTMPWLNDRRAWCFSSEAPMGQQTEIDPAHGVILFELRQGVVKDTNSGYSMRFADRTKETPGVMLWIAPAAAGE